MIAGKARRHIIAALQFALGLGVLSYLLFSGAIDWNRIRPVLTVHWILPVTAGLCLVNYAFMALRLRVLMQAQGLHLSLTAAYRLTVTAAFFSWVIPGGTGGDLVKMYFLGRWYPGKLTEAITITLWDRAIGLATFLMLALMAAGLFPGWVKNQPVILALLGTCAGALLIGGIILTIALLADWTRRWPLNLLTRLGRPGETILRMFRVMYAYRQKPSALPAAIVLSLGAQSCLLATALTLATAVVEGGADRKMLMLLPMGWVTNALPVSPGGLGVGEMAQEELFKLAGLSGGATVSLTWRAVAIIMSLPGAWYYFRSRHPTSIDRQKTSPGKPSNP